MYPHARVCKTHTLVPGKYSILFVRLFFPRRFTSITTFYLDALSGRFRAERALKTNRILFQRGAPVNHYENLVTILKFLFP